MKKNMEENFEKLHERVKDAFSKTDLERIKKELEQIKEATLVSGVGGSSVVSEFTTKVLNQKNGIITRNTEPRDFNYLNLRGYKNVLACSYSGNNY
jgi:glucose-6-phosphate isomerase